MYRLGRYRLQRMRSIVKAVLIVFVLMVPCLLVTMKQGSNLTVYKDEKRGSKSNFTVYKDKKRGSKGSQSETPHYEINGERLVVDGYQEYILLPGKVVFMKKQLKFETIRRELQKVVTKYQLSSFIDFGCSAGLTSFIAREVGFTDISSLDHDVEYIAMLKEIVKHQKVTNIKPSTFSFGDPLSIQSEVMFVGALIHWVFSCTANFGEFNSIFRYLETAVTQFLFIEWIDPTDGAIREFNHLDCGENGKLNKEEYSVKNFEKGLKSFGEIQANIPVDGGGTRVLYIVKKHHS